MEKINGFIVHPTYKVIDGKAFVYLYGRLSNGESFLTINHYKSYFYIKKKDQKKLKNIEIKYEILEKDFKNFDDENVIKIIYNNPSDTKELRNKFEENEIECYEADIRLQYRFMMDKDLLSSCEIEGEYEKGEFVNRIYNEPKLTSSKENNFKLKVLSFDIETDGLSQKLYSIAVYGDNLKKAIYVNRSNKKIEIENCITVSNEKDALLEFNKIIKEYDPDIITGWNVIDFDFAFLSNKYKQQKVPFNICRENQEASVRIEDSFMQTSKVNAIGRSVIDSLDLLRNTFYKLEDYKLDTAAKELLGEEKIISGENKVKQIEDAYNNDPNKLIEYNIKDAELVYKILEKTNLIELTIKRSLLVGMPPDRVQASVASLDSLYLRELKKIKYVAPCSKFNKKEKGISGGFVMKSKPGIYENVIVCDFKSLYPSVMRTFNIDPISYHRGKNSKDFIQAPNGAKFDKKEGLLPSILKKLWFSRDEMKKKDDKVGSYAIKIHMNSMYGSLANPSCRFYDYNMADAITSLSRETLKQSADLLKKENYEVIYQDTDSNFINPNTKEVEQAKQIGKKVELLINNYFNKLIKEKYNRNNIIEIEFEKLYTMFMMPFQRGSTEGAKKRYAGLLLDFKTNETKIDFTGLEFVRRDWTAVSKKFQLELLDKIFKKEEVSQYIKQFVKDLEKGKYDDLLIYRKALRKNTEEYIKTTPPHVKAARILEEHGKIESSIIEYVITTKGPEPVSLQKNKIDYEHYTQKQIKPIADSVLIFFDKSFDDLISGNNQSNLFDY
jgi:DNA polymerase II